MLLGLFIGLILVLCTVHTLYVQKSKMNILEAKNQVLTDRLHAFADIYHSMHIVDLDEDSYIEFKTSEGINKSLDRRLNAHEAIIKVLESTTDPQYLESAKEFLNFDTMSERLAMEKTISAEFKSIGPGWFRTRLIASGERADGTVNSVIVVTVIVEEEKNKEEGLIKISYTDELTQLNNRRAFEEAIKKLDDEYDDSVIISIDINGLKIVNDTLGHIAGDELIIGASKCMRDAFMDYGDIYRVGGDEFVVIMHIDDDRLKSVIYEFDKLVKEWKGEMVNELSVSYGFAKRLDNSECSMKELCVIADEAMYDMKKAYYETKGFSKNK